VDTQQGYSATGTLENYPSSEPYSHPPDRSCPCKNTGPRPLVGGGIASPNLYAERARLCPTAYKSGPPLFLFLVTGYAGKSSCLTYPLLAKGAVMTHRQLSKGCLTSLLKVEFPGIRSQETEIVD
jgi:hypothetical protein